MTFLAGTLAVLLVVGVMGGASRALRGAVLADRSGGEARLAEIVLGLTLVLGTAQVVGAFGAFHPGIVLVAELVVGVLAWTVGARLRRRVASGGGPADHGPGDAEQEAGEETLTPERSRSEASMRVVALLGTGVVAVQWVLHTGDAVRRGMTHADTLWYHLPFAARIVQSGDFDHLDGVGYEAARAFPLDSQLVHALGLLSVGSDAWSPYLNLAWAAFAILGAWCIGHRRGHGSLAVLAAAVALSVPALTATQPGQASSDIACAALLLAAVALLFEAQDLEPAPVALAGLATGLSLSTKVTIAAPVAILVLGTFATILVARRFRVAAIWAASVFATGSFWFLHNWAQTGSPLPWFDLALGPVRMPATVGEQGPPLATTVLDGALWRRLYLPGLSQGLGRAWPLVLALAVLGALLAIVRGRRFERLVGVAVVGGLVGYVFTPLTGGQSFVFNLRYLTPMLLLGFVLLARFCPRGRTGRLVLAGSLVVALVADALTPHEERVEAWPMEPLPWILLISCVCVVLATMFRWSLARRETWLPATVGAAALALVVVGAWAGQRSYLDHRYLDAGLHGSEVDRYFRTVGDARVAVLGNNETYPMFGLHSTNRVTIISGGAFPREDACRNWRRTFDGQFDYIVLDRFGFNLDPQPEPWILAQDAATTQVVRDGDNVVYRIDGPLHPQACPP